ncbi:hypothetical protein QQ045_023689 [Rhodiola kirilowii]
MKYFNEVINAVNDSKTVKQGTELNGVIHWLAESLTRRVTKKFVLTFDLKKEIFGRIEIPHGTRGRGASLAKLDDQCLSLIVPSFDCTDVWVMRYGESWVRQAKLGPSRIDNSTMLGYWHNFKGLLLEDRGEDMGIVMVIGNKGILSDDLLLKIISLFQHSNIMQRSYSTISS